MNKHKYKGGKYECGHRCKFRVGYYIVFKKGLRDTPVYWCVDCGALNRDGKWVKPKVVIR